MLNKPNYRKHEGKYTKTNHNQISQRHLKELKRKKS